MTTLPSIEISITSMKNLQEKQDITIRTHNHHDCKKKKYVLYNDYFLKKLPGRIIFMFPKLCDIN